MTALSLGFVLSAFLAVLFSVEAFHEIQIKECNAPHMSFHNSLRPDLLCQHGCIEETLVDPEQCGPNEVYHHANKTNYCLIGCRSGCYCKPGYMMMDKGCVPEKFGDIKCGENEELKCGTYDCQNFCDIGIDPMCYLNRFDCYFNYECVCKEGFTRIDEGDCIPVENCPSEVFHLDYEED